MSDMMKCFVMHGIGTVGLMDKPVPRPGPNDAIVCTTAALICTSDTHTVGGAIGDRRGLTLGHEAVGAIHELGEVAAASGLFKIGQRVAVRRSSRHDSVLILSTLLPATVREVVELRIQTIQAHIYPDATVDTTGHRLSIAKRRCLGCSGTLGPGVRVASRGLKCSSGVRRRLVRLRQGSEPRTISMNESITINDCYAG